MFGPNGGLVANAPHIPVHLGAMQEAVQYQVCRVYFLSQTDTVQFISSLFVLVKEYCLTRHFFSFRAVLNFGRTTFTAVFLLQNIPRLNYSEMYTHLYFFCIAIRIIWQLGFAWDPDWGSYCPQTSIWSWWGTKEVWLTLSNIFHDLWIFDFLFGDKVQDYEFLPARGRWRLAAGSWGVKAGMVLVWVAGKTVRFHC